MEMRVDEVSVAVDDVHKWYRVYASPFERVKRLVGGRSRHLDFQALDGVSFQVPRGEAVGVIGENGAGKSTLLKLVAGTTMPTAGTITVEGSVAAILELGAGFHPEFTGRDNAILYGALVGLDAEQMTERLPAIIAFAELGQFIDHPVKSYSTGMAMRLAFAVATHVDPDVLIVDEALAVGDGYFQKKCVDRILEIKARGTTILFCSHAMYYVTMFCDRAVWLHRGRVERIGAAHEVVDAYERHLLLRDKRRLEEPAATSAGDASGRKVGRVVDVRVDHGPGRANGTVDLAFELDLESTVVDERYHVGVSLDTLDGKCVLAEATFLDGREPLSGGVRYTARLEIPDLTLAGGAFSVTAYLLDETGLHVHDQVIVPEALHLERDRWHPALIEAPHAWSVRTELPDSASADDGDLLEGAERGT
jgi:lipopolysaccharide transport system ATP-binding protein